MYSVIILLAKVANSSIMLIEETKRIVSVHVHIWQENNKLTLYL